MVDVGIDVGSLPEFVSFDDPGFDAFVDELTAIWAAAEPRPVEEADLSYLATLPTGSVAASMLTEIDATGVSGRNRVSLLQARIRSHSHFQALIYEDIAAIHDACADLVDPELVWEVAASEIRAALRLTRRAADHHLDLALALRDRLPTVLEALRAGEIDQRRATVIVNGTIHLPDDAARLVADQVLPRAGRLTTGQLRERVRKLAIETAPDTARERYEQAIERRRVELEPTDDGAADLMVLAAPPTGPRPPAATSIESPDRSAVLTRLEASTSSAPTSPSTSSPDTRRPAANRPLEPEGRCISPSTSPR